MTVAEVPLIFDVEIAVKFFSPNHPMTKAQPAGSLHTPDSYIQTTSRSLESHPIPFPNAIAVPPV